MNRLLAKSYDRDEFPTAPPDYALLSQHSRDVAAACRALAECAGAAALQNAGLDLSRFREFALALRANGWMQDVGKAGSHFQEMVTVEPQIRQMLRHETVSGILMWLNPEIRQWLSPLPKMLFIASVWGALGHHRKFDEETSPEECLPLIVGVAHRDFATILAEMSADLGLSAPPTFERDLIIGKNSRVICDLPAFESILELQDQFSETEVLFSDDRSRRLLALVKGFGIAADVAASAVAARGQQAANYCLGDYIAECFNIGLTPGELSSLISKWAWARTKIRNESIDRSSLPPDFEVRDFQLHVADSESALTLAQAGCGSGKSLAAYMWARRWCEKYKNQGRSGFRLFFCLPTTGTTTEHFKDYALESGIDSSLTHSRASVDLKAIAETAPQEEAGDAHASAAEAAQATISAERDKIESLALWSTPLVVTTADTVLGLMSNARKSIYSLPAIMNGAIVFDEIHAFDDQMFGHLLVFLKNFPGLPVLLMTASLPDERRRAIVSVRPDLEVIEGPKEFEMLERYQIHAPVSEPEVWNELDRCVEDNGKVLWVCNRVEWANDFYTKCRDRYKTVDTDVYHSRFRYKDRSERHRRVIDNFKREGVAAILVATQVAEMSLDLSADLLITDIAPIPSLIQRLGRLNRHATPDLPIKMRPPKPALVCALPENKPNVEKPYAKEDLEKARQWLSILTDRNKALSQYDLSNAFATFAEDGEYNINSAEERACFFSGLWRTRPGKTRGEGHTVSVILENDLEQCKERDRAGMPKRDWLREHEVSILFKKRVLGWKRIGTLRIARHDEVAYDFDEITKEGTGARWRDN